MCEKFGCEGVWRPLLYVTLCVYLVREILFLSGKSQAILHTDACGNHVVIPQPLFLTISKVILENFAV